MKLPKFKLKPVDESFFSSAPVVLTGEFEIAKPAAKVWDELTADHPLSWCRIIGASGINWKSERPFGVGTKRHVSALKGLNQFDEHFFIWEEGRRHSFYATEASGPMFKRFAEDYLVEPDGVGACRFTWIIAYEPTLLGKGPVNKQIMQTMFADTRKHYAA